MFQLHAYLSALQKTLLKWDLPSFSWSPLFSEIVVTFVPLGLPNIYLQYLKTHHYLIEWKISVNTTAQIFINRQTKGLTNGLNRKKIKLNHDSYCGKSRFSDLWPRVTVQSIDNKTFIQWTPGSHNYCSNKQIIID